MNLIDRKGLRTWIEIERKAILNNFNSIQSFLPKGTKYLSVVKSNAYGHSLVDFATEMEKLPVDYLGVDSIVEAISLRNSNIKKPILVLGYTLPEMLSKALEFDIEISVSTFELLDEIEKLDSPERVKIHIKIDTGMHRQGFQDGDMSKLLSTLKSLEVKLEVVGLFTHFAAVKNSDFLNYTEKQFESFKVWKQEFLNQGFSPIIHCSASGGLMAFPQANFDMVRVGIAQYGIFPSEEVEKIVDDKLRLKPIMEWRSLVSEIKNLPKGSLVGYDLTEELKRDSKIAIVPIGYWHGFPRSLSGVGIVLVSGKRARVLGKVSMDMIIIDITGIEDVAVGSVVTLIGRDDDEEISAQELSNLANCSVYELVTRINPRIRKIYY